VAKKVSLAVCVKANAYGLGALRVSEKLLGCGCKDFFTASLEEAELIRNNLVGQDFNIYVLNGVHESEIEKFIELNLIPVLNNLYQVELCNRQGALLDKKIRAVLHVDTGIHRLGLDCDQVGFLIQNPTLLENIDLIYLMSHLAASEEQEEKYNKLQLVGFTEIAKHFHSVPLSLGNSGGLFLGKEYHFDMLRIGAGLYGIGDCSSREQRLNNPLYINSSIIHIQEVPSNSYVGYNMTFQTTRYSRLVTLPIGYADGYPRSLSNRGRVVISGYYAPIVGKISMDLTVVDATDVPLDKIFLGQKVEIVGDRLSIREIAKLCDTIEYEILTSISKGRYRHIWV
jgi:alanine racemase